MVRIKFFFGQESRFLAKKSDFCHATPILVYGPIVALGKTVPISQNDELLNFGKKLLGNHSF